MLHGRPSNNDWIKDGDWSRGTCSPNANHNIFHDSSRLLGSVLKSDGRAGLLANDTQFTELGAVINFDD
jgi:hypothetical protein